MDWARYETILLELRYVLLQGTPPLYQQLLIATGIYILVRLWIHWRNRHVRRVLIEPEVITGLWLISLELLSLGLVQHLQYLYRTYIIYIERVLTSMIA